MDVNKMIAYVQIYIHIRKNEQIQINIQGLRDIMLLKQAYDYAVSWMDANNVKLTVI